MKKMDKIGMGTGGNRIDHTLLSNLLKTSIKNDNLRTIDTAIVYFNEYLIGNILEEIEIPREEFFLCSKIPFCNFIENRIEKSVDESLRRLKTNYIDLMYLHQPSRNFDDTLHAYKELIKQKELGKIRNIGVSNFSKAQLEKLYEETKIHPFANQVYLSPITTNPELETYCRKNDIKLVAYSTNRSFFNPENAFDSEKMTNEEREIIKNIANKYNQHPVNVISSWALSKGYYLIPRGSSPEKNTSNLSVTEFLSKDDLEIMNSLSKSNEEKQFAHIFEVELGMEKRLPKVNQLGLFFDEKPDLEKYKI